MRTLTTIKSTRQGSKWAEVSRITENITDEEYNILANGWKWARVYKNYHRHGYEPEKLITYAPDRSERCMYIVKD